MVCNRCKYDNRASAAVCARCGSALPASANANGIATAEKPRSNLDWLLQGTSQFPVAGPEPAFDNPPLKPSQTGPDMSPSSPAVASLPAASQVATAVAWQVQVRRSRTPLIQGSREPIAATEVLQPPPEDTSASTSDDEKKDNPFFVPSTTLAAGRTLSRKRFDARIIIMFVVLVALLVLLYILAGGSL